MILSHSDISYHINKFLDVYSILNIRQSFKNTNTYKILSKSNYIRDITLGSYYYIDEKDKYNIKLRIYDNYYYFDKLNILETLKNHNIIALNIIRSNCFKTKLTENINIKELIFDLLKKNTTKILIIDSHLLHILLNFINNKYKPNIKLETICIKDLQYNDPFYWDRNLHTIYNVFSTFKNIQNILFTTTKLNSEYYNIIKKNTLILDSKYITNQIQKNTNYLDYYLDYYNLNYMLFIQFNIEEILHTCNIYFYKEIN